MSAYFFSNRNRVILLVIGTEGNVNLQRVKSTVSADLVIFTEEILNEKLHFLCIVNYFRILLDFLSVTFRHI